MSNLIFAGTQRWVGTDNDHNDIPVDHDNYEGILSITAPSVTAVYFAAPGTLIVGY